MVTHWFATCLQAPLRRGIRRRGRACPGLFFRLRRKSRGELVATFNLLFRCNFGRPFLFINFLFDLLRIYENSCDKPPPSEAPTFFARGEKRGPQHTRQGLETSCILVCHVCRNNQFAFFQILYSSPFQCYIF